MRKAKIIGTGLYAPKRVIPNAYFNDLYQQDVDAFLRENRNIFERRYMTEGQTTSDLAAEAGLRAIENAGLQPQDIQLVVVATDTPDFLSPSTAAIVQHKIGATGAGSFDVNTACAGFATALDIGSKYIGADPHYQYVLVIGAYGMSRFLDFRDRNVSTLFADGAGAAVLMPSNDGSGIRASRLWSDGQYNDYMGLYVGGAAMPPTEALIHEQQHLLQFRKKFPKTFNFDLWTGVIQELCIELDIVPQEVDRYFFTQINILTIREVLGHFEIPETKTHYIMDRYGYTGSAAIPMALADANEVGKLRRGDWVFIITSGGGAAMAALALRW
ncbi:MAG TPA: ketoacyl-ACP synthase III [Rhodothermales bacterium]|nr:ketoacyl-ACP synthase III [Bacteroidota bacterium]HRK72893.1 ketoacyl-ACP synthase III [Rhodothermales bacterium]HRR08101.1 ketoacyl-ACP synthase III [Rhodothermales bacterium]